MRLRHRVPGRQQWLLGEKIAIKFRSLGELKSCHWGAVEARILHQLVWEVNAALAQSARAAMAMDVWRRWLGNLHWKEAAADSMMENMAIYEWILSTQTWSEVVWFGEQGWRRKGWKHSQPPGGWWAYKPNSVHNLGTRRLTGNDGLSAHRTA